MLLVLCWLWLSGSFQGFAGCTGWMGRIPRINSHIVGFVLVVAFG